MNRSSVLNLGDKVYGVNHNFHIIEYEIISVNFQRRGTVYNAKPLDNREVQDFQEKDQLDIYEQKGVCSKIYTKHDKLVELLQSIGKYNPLRL